MRLLVPALLAISVTALAAQSAPARAAAQAPDAASILAASRTALGGEARLAAVKTFIANGRTRQVRGDNLVPIEFEIQAELPDKYSRRDEFPAQDAGPTTAGFVAESLVLIPRPLPPPARPGAPPPPAGQQDAALRARLTAAKHDFARLVLGMFATSLPSFPLTFGYAAQAEAPQGKAHVLDVKGPANFSARLFIDATTNLPLMLSWQGSAPPSRAPGGPPSGGAAGAGNASAPSGAPPAPVTAPSSSVPQGAGPTAKPGAAPPGASAEQRMFFADYRDVEGLKLPFRIRRAVGADTTEETTFDRFRINAKLDPRRFDTTTK